MKYFLLFLLCMAVYGSASSQITNIADTIKRDTIFIEVNSREITDVRKGTSRMIVLKNVVTEPIRDMSIYLESTRKNQIKWKEIEFKNNEIWIPTDLVTDDYYTLYVMKGREILFMRRLRIK